MCNYVHWNYTRYDSARSHIIRYLLWNPCFRRERERIIIQSLSLLKTVIGLFKIPVGFLKAPTAYFQIPTAFLNLPASFLKIPSGIVKKPTSYLKLPTAFLKNPACFCKIPTGFLKKPTCFSIYRNSTLKYIHFKIKQINLLFNHKKQMLWKSKNQLSITCMYRISSW